MQKLIVILLTALLCTIAFAAPTIDGTSGLLVMPTADSLKYKEFNVAADWSTRAASSNNQVLWKYKANIGAFGGLEIGFVGQNDREGVFVNLKYYLLSDNTKYPLKMALGIDNLTSYNKTDAYMVASKRFNASFAGHFGFKVDLANGETNTSLLVGSEYFLADNLAWVSDLDGEQSQYMINTGIRFFFHPNGMISLSILNLTNQNISDEYPEAKFNAGIVWTDFL
ncbi:MAG: hypothetical protein ABIH39_04600 [Candidatus Margulisiibacteriota bacterium]